jgi:uncharacterized protein Yka (UPF0111/DUF47 family)
MKNHKANTMKKKTLLSVTKGFFLLQFKSENLDLNSSVKISI